jgi:hypothetical protein
MLICGIMRRRSVNLLRRIIISLLLIHLPLSVIQQLVLEQVPLEISLTTER